MARKKRTWRAGLLAMLLSTAFALTVAEFVLRRFFPILYAALPEALEYDDRTG